MTVRIRASILLAVLFMLCMTCAQAEEQTVFFSDGRKAAGPVERVSLYKKSGTYYLFLPAGWDRACLRIEYDGNTELYAQSLALPSGTVTDAFAFEDEVVLTNERGGTEYNVHIMQGSLPAVFLLSESGAMRAIHSSKENREPGQIVFIEADGEVCVEGDLQHIRIRGNVTTEYPKKAYQIKLEKKAELIEGAGKARTWVLLADHLDMSLLRNRITLDLAREIGVQWAVCCRSVDVYTNGEYRGVYLLTEKVQEGSERVAIDDQQTAAAMLNPDRPLSAFERKKRTHNDLKVAWFDIPVQLEDVTGGYLLEIDKAGRVRNAEDAGYCFTEKGFGFLVEAPEYPSQRQVEYLSDLLNAIERAIFASDGVDPETGKRWEEMIDADSFALKFIIEEFSANYDAKAGSQYFWKRSDKEDGKLYAGPAWDYDLTYAASINMTADRPLFKIDITRDSWYYALFTYQPEFRLRVHQLYQERMLPALAILNGTSGETGVAIRPFDAYVQEIAASAEMNFVRNREAGVEGAHYRTGRTHEEAVGYLRQFLVERTQAMADYYRESATQ